MRRVLLSFIGLVVLTCAATAQTPPPRTKIAILDFGPSKLGKQTATKIRVSFRGLSPDLQVLDADLTAAAAKGTGYNGSLNLSLAEARDLGSVLESEFYVLGDAQTLRRSSSSNPLYYESYLSIFLISARTGRLVFWDRLSAESDKADTAEAALFNSLQRKETTERWLTPLRKAQIDERNERAAVLETNAPLLEEAPDDDQAATEMGVSLPKPYRRLRPAYPASAARADVEATVDVLVDIGADGEVDHVQVARWAGFGLDEITIATVRQLHFFPAKRNGNPIPMRVLLRYNFRKPAP
jgi:TonB family protein